MSDAELIKALVKARMACKAVVKKEGRNQAQSYSYVGHEHVLTSGAREALLTNGLVLVESGVHYVGEMHYATKNGQQTCWRWKGEFLLLHEAGGVLKFEFEATTGTNDKTGFVASTALDRTALLRICQLAGSAHEDPEHDSNERYEDTAKRTQRVAKTLDEIASGGDAAARPVQPARGGEPRPLASASAGGPALTAKAAETGAAGAAPAHAAGSNADSAAVSSTDAIDELVTRYNMAAKAAAEFANLPFTGECDDNGCMIPPGVVPVFESGDASGQRYDDPALLGKVRGMAKSKMFKEQAPPLKQIWVAYIITRRDIQKLLKEDGNG